MLCSFQKPLCLWKDVVPYVYDVPMEDDKVNVSTLVSLVVHDMDFQGHSALLLIVSTSLVAFLGEGTKRLAPVEYGANRWCERCLPWHASRQNATWTKSDGDNFLLTSLGLIAFSGHLFRFVKVVDCDAPTHRLARLVHLAGVVVIQADTQGFRRRGGSIRRSGIGLQLDGPGMSFDHGLFGCL